ncbi:MAG: two-component regulator propeller domain-containing protein [Pseudomonadota bacterium]
MSWTPPNRFLLALALSCGAALAQPLAPVDAATPHVIETFNVGDDAYVRALAVERSAGALWVGTSKGVHEIDVASGKLRQTFTRANGLANEYVFAIGIDQQGYKWFGTNAGGASRYKDGVWKTFFPMHGLADYWVYSFASQANGDLWIGTWAGVNVVDMKTLKFRTYVKELINEWVYGLAVDAKQQVWFGTEGGVSMFDGKRWRSWNHKDGLGAGNIKQLVASSNTGLGTRSRHDLGLRAGDGAPTFNPNYVFSILVAADQTIWAGTWGGGVSHWDGQRWTNYTVKDGLAGDIVYSIVQDAKGVLWFGTSAGLTRYDGKLWRSVDTRGGLLDNNVYALAVAPNGDLWAGTKRGVARVGLSKVK